MQRIIITSIAVIVLSGIILLLVRYRHELPQNVDSRGPGTAPAAVAVPPPAPVPEVVVRETPASPTTNSGTRLDVQRRMAALDADLQVQVQAARRRLAVVDRNDPAIRRHLEMLQALAGGDPDFLVGYRKRAEADRSLASMGVAVDDTVAKGMAELFVAESIARAKRQLPIWEAGLAGEGRDRDIVRAELLLDWDFTVSWTVMTSRRDEVVRLIGEEPYRRLMDRMTAEARESIEGVRMVDRLLREIGGQGADQ